MLNHCLQSNNMDMDMNMDMNVDMNMAYVMLQRLMDRVHTMLLQLLLLQNDLVLVAELATPTGA